jgi:membrane protein DedA with SNARE-associated domain
MTQHMPWILGVWVLANQGGVPLPVAPGLVAAGALAGSGQVSCTLVLACAVAAALVADLVWYGLGRWRGAQTLAACFRLMRLPSASVNRVLDVLRAHPVGFMWSARFLPELNPVAAGLAGAARMVPVRFLVHAAGSAVGWAGGWTGLGYLLAEVAVKRERPSFWVPGAVMVTATLAAVTVSVLVTLALHRWRRRPFTKAGASESAPRPSVERHGFHPLDELGMDTWRPNDGRTETVCSPRDEAARAA